jgi:hypothetical protein
MGEQAIPEEDSDVVSPARSHRGTTPTDHGTVHDVVMDESRQVDHLEQHGDRDMVLHDASDAPGAEAHEGGSELFTPVVEGIAGLARDLGLEAVHLGLQPT